MMVPPALKIREWKSQNFLSMLFPLPTGLGDTEGTEVAMTFCIYDTHIISLCCLKYRHSLDTLPAHFSCIDVLLQLMKHGRPLSITHTHTHTCMWSCLAI